MNWAIALLALQISMAPASAASEQADGAVEGHVIRVIDGDTFMFDLSRLGVIRVRIWGIDAPELHVPAGARAAFVFRSLITAEGAQLICTYKDVDRHRRLVAKCHTAHGTDIAAHLVGEGVARDCARYSKGHYAQFESPASLALPEAPFCRR